VKDKKSLLGAAVMSTIYMKILLKLDLEPMGMFHFSSNQFLSKYFVNESNIFPREVTKARLKSNPSQIVALKKIKDASETEGVRFYLSTLFSVI